MRVSRRPGRGVGATAVVMLLIVMLIAGCGASDPRRVASVTAPTGAQSPEDRSGDGTGRTSTTGPGPGASPGGASSAQQTPHTVAPAHPVPAAFRPAPGAPSDAEVQRELDQMAGIQRKQRQQELSAAAASLAGLLPWSLEPKSGTQVSVASVFTDYGLGLACGGVLGRDELGVAHKTAPCGTLITFTYGGRSVTVPVIDRGPYIAGREWDLTGATAAALGFPGLGPIRWSLAS
jgi:rare lipoprotein A (peptidoglycan hydrolase)